MNDPESYHKAEFFKSEVRNFFDEYKAKIRFRPDGQDSLLDIGCAGGNITVDVIRSMLPETFSRLVGVDISETMIAYAKKNFEIPKVSFEVLDIGGDITDFAKVHNSFDHITSSLCLHLLPYQEQTLTNIFNLLQPTGDCLLYILVDCFVFDVYVMMDKKWLRFMEDIDDYISPYYRKANPEYLLKKYLKSAGFAQYEVKLITETLVFDDVQKFKDNYQSVIPFFGRMSTIEQVDFMQEFTNLALEITSTHDDQLNGKFNDDDTRIILPYKLMTAFAKKELLS